MSYLINHLWQSTLFAAVAWLLNLYVLRVNRASVRYSVWMAASLKFLVPFGALADWGSRLGGFRPARALAQTSVYIAMDHIGRNVTAPVSAVAANPAGVVHQSAWPEALLAVWALGFIAVAVNLWVKWRRVSAAMRPGRLIATKDGIPVFASPALRDRGIEPGVVGLWQPVIVVPAGVEERLTAEQFEAILAHECCHVQRRDNAAAAVHMTVEALFWFHPLVWWLGRKLMEERERACDESVLLRHGGDPAVYAQGILNICKFYVESPLRCVAGVTGADLKRRIREIMDHRLAMQLSVAKKILLAAAGVLSIAGPAAVGLLNSPFSFGQTNTTQYTSGLNTVAEKKFDVASIRPDESDPNRWQLPPPLHGELHTLNLPLRRLVASAFRTQDSTVVGPGWINDARYDVDAKGPDPTVPYAVVWEELRSLLVERFHLQYHIEQREQPVLALVVAKGGPKLKRPEEGPCAEKIKQHVHCANLDFGPTGISITNMPIQNLLSGLARLMGDRHLVDKTGLTGDYDVEVSWAPDPQNARLDESSLFTALQEQAGLRLEAQKGLVNFLVIDHVERPSGN